MNDPPPFQSTIPFSERFDAAAVYCSDGRFGDQVGQFMRDGLAVKNFDRIAVPGGPGALIGHKGANMQAGGVLADLKFLIEAHELSRVVLIAHDGCAFYKAALGLDATQLEPQQHTDLKAAAESIRRAVNVPTIEAYFARRTPDNTIAFEPVPVE